MTAIASSVQVLVDPDTIRREYCAVPTVAIDIETTGLSPSRDRIAVVSLAAPARPSAVLRVPGGAVPDWLLDLVSRPGVVVIGHNLAAFDLPFFIHAGVRPHPGATYVDTLILEQLCLVSGRRDLRKDLQTVLARRLQVSIDKSIDHTGWEAAELSEQQLLYAARDVAYLHALYDAQLAHLRGYNLLDALENELRLVPVTASIVARGVPFRPHAVEESAKRHLEAAQRATEQLRALGLHNPRSAIQVRRLFADRFGLSLQSTDADTLQVVASSNGPVADVARFVLQARQDYKATMYDAEWLSRYCDSDNRVRARYWQLGTDTGRYSSSDPNLQQIPRAMREIVGYDSGQGRSIVSIDYSQLEVVIAAALFQDPALLRAIVQSDVHSYTASLMYRVPPERVTPTQRRAAKAATFTALFAGGIPGIQRSAHQLGVVLSSAEAADVLRSFYHAYPVVQQRITSLRHTIEQHRARGLPYRVRIPGGPLRYLIDDRLSASTAVNTLVQGTAAVGLKHAMRRIWEQYGELLVATVHDEVVLDVPSDAAPRVAADCQRVMAEEMRAVVGLPVSTSVKIASTWGGDTEPRSVHTS